MLDAAFVPAKSWNGGGRGSRDERDSNSSDHGTVLHIDIESDILSRELIIKSAIVALRTSPRSPQHTTYLDLSLAGVRVLHLIRLRHRDNQNLKHK